MTLPTLSIKIGYISDIYYKKGKRLLNKCSIYFCLRYSEIFYCRTAKDREGLKGLRLWENKPTLPLFGSQMNHIFLKPSTSVRSKFLWELR